MKIAPDIVLFDGAKHLETVVELWETVFGYENAHNDPGLAIGKKEAMDDGLLFVAVLADRKVVGTVMAGYDGYRGWVYSLAVLPAYGRSGIGTALMESAEKALEAQGCMKINLQIVAGKGEVQGFYESNGYKVEERISMGKIVPSNIPNELSQ